MKRFTIKGEQTLSQFQEKLLITKTIYNLNKYNKAWLNTNLAKTPTLFTVEFQELLQIFWETYCFYSREFFTFTCIHTLHLQEHGFLYETGFLPGFKFSISHITDGQVFFGLISFWINWLQTKGVTKTKALKN